MAGHFPARSIGCMLALTVASPATAAVVAVPIAAFPAGPANITFTGIADNTEVNGLIVGGVSFAYLVGGNPQNGQVIINGGPGVTNNVNNPNIVSTGNASGTLVITLPNAVDLFGYGYAVLATGVVPNATTISVFDGATALGTLSYTGLPDPNFAGGFAGIQSTVAFNRVEVTFNSTAAPAFALDNIRFASGAVPEPASWAMMLIGFGGLGYSMRCRGATTRIRFA